MLKITDIDRINWLLNTNKQLKALSEAKKLGLSDCDFQVSRTLFLLVNSSYPDDNLKSIQADILLSLKKDIIHAIENARNNIGAKLINYGVNINE